MVQVNLTSETINVKSDNVIGSIYAQIVGVIVTDEDITLEFAYRIPRKEIKEANVVARVTLPFRAGEGLGKGILDTIKLHKQRKENSNVK